MITDNTAKWKVKKLSNLNTSNGIPVGFEYISMNPNIPQGSLPMFGGVYDRKVYADLWAWVQQQVGYIISDSEWQGLFNSNDGNVPFYSTGDGSTTFRVPSISCWVKGANGIEEVSSYYTDTVDGSSLILTSEGEHTHTRGTMNITGGGFGVISGETKVNGAFSLTYDSAYGRGGGSVRDKSMLTFDASQSWTGETSGVTAHTHTVTGDGNETKPKTIVGMWLVKAYGTLSNVGNVEISDILQAVNDSRMILRIW